MTTKFFQCGFPLKGHTHHKSVFSNKAHYQIDGLFLSNRTNFLNALVTSFSIKINIMKQTHWKFLLWRNLYVLVLIVAGITRDTIFTMILLVENFEDPHQQLQARHEIDYLEHTRWILKDTRGTHNLTWFDSNLAYFHGERTWESFINELDTKRSNLPLDDTRVFIFPFNLFKLQEYIFSLCIFTLLLSFLTF